MRQQVKLRFDDDFRGGMVGFRACAVVLSTRDALLRDDPIPEVGASREWEWESELGGVWARNGSWREREIGPIFFVLIILGHILPFQTRCER